LENDKWSESGRLWEDDHGWLDDEQIAKCARVRQQEIGIDWRHGRGAVAISDP
jgi:hypothetical protein